MQNCRYCNVHFCELSLEQGWRSCSETSTSVATIGIRRYRRQPAGDQRESDNTHDRYTVAVEGAGTVLRHLPAFSQRLS